MCEKQEDEKAYEICRSGIQRTFGRMPNISYLSLEDRGELYVAGGYRSCA
jgi:hypothetical protein